MAEPEGSGGEGVAVTGSRTFVSPGHASRHGPHAEDEVAPAVAPRAADPPARGRGDGWC